MPMPWSQDPRYKHIPGWWNTAVPGPALPPDPQVIEQVRASARSFLKAWDPVKQRAAWSVELRGPWNGGVLATGGQLVFQGTADGRFVAYDAANGDKLWEMRTQTATLAGPISYSVDGEQYIAVPGGFGSIFFLAMGIVMPVEAVPKQHGRVFAFKLGGTATLPPEPLVDRSIPPPPRIDAPAAVVKRGAELYQDFCWPCHGANVVSAGVLPDLRRTPILQSPAAWQSVVLGGALKDNGMASFAKWLNEADALALRAYVASEAARVTPPAEQPMPSG
jgi:quinohemoprotein ethanol dehydrogenase